MRYVISGTTISYRRASHKDFCKFKPHLVKTVISCSGRKYKVRKYPSHHRFWLWRCSVCGKTGIRRADNINSLRCKCQKTKKKRPRMPRAKKRIFTEKICRICKKTLPLTIKYWYKSKTGYFSSYCKTCDCGRHVSDRQFSSSIHYTPEDCGRSE